MRGDQGMLFLFVEFDFVVQEKLFYYIHMNTMTDM